MNTQTPIEMVLDEITEKMYAIEQINHRYNLATTFGQFPNGQEAYIEQLLNEWDHLKCRREKVKLLMN